MVDIAVKRSMNIGLKFTGHSYLAHQVGVIASGRLDKPVQDILVILQEGQLGRAL